MSGEAPRRGLGRGLSALLGDPAPVAAPVTPTVMMATTIPTTPGEASVPVSMVDPSRLVRYLPIEKLYPGKFQPRRVFDQNAIDDLAESVKAKGILQPILVRPLEKQDRFEIIAGERRWRAAQKANLHEVPVIVREMADIEALEIALIENLQRQDLSPLEEAEGYRRLMNEFKHTQEELAQVVGKSRSHVANTMRLLALPDPVKKLLDDGALSAGHARALLTSPDPVALAEQVVAKGLNVRQTEALANQQPGKSPKAGKTAGGSKPAAGDSAYRDADVESLERDLSNLLGLRVSIRTASQQGGELAVEYGSLEQLDDILHRLSGGLHGRANIPAGFGDE
ncbi:MAG TPA: ParB/RepB/Spo0J family partition protein [Candidatus Sulfotelmatobacter sp.]|jgi:ParB family chromosome partitioning protein|nr:ParB/RepB/Spo0J family partition protein [Candidatus Sulfotelmatobacter sp.]